MYSKNIGDINISDDHTEFEINAKAVKGLTNLQIKSIRDAN